MKAFKVKNLKRFSNFIRILVIVLFLNSLLSLFVFLAGSYNIFVYNFQKFYLDLAIILSSVSFGLESTRLIFFYFLKNKKIKAKKSFLTYIDFIFPVTFLKSYNIDLILIKVFLEFLPQQDL